MQMGGGEEDEEDAKYWQHSFPVNTIQPFVKWSSIPSGSFQVDTLGASGGGVLSAGGVPSSLLPSLMVVSSCYCVVMKGDEKREKGLPNPAGLNSTPFKLS